MKSAVQMESEPMTLVECLGQCDEARSEAGALRDALDAVVPEIELLRVKAERLRAGLSDVLAYVRNKDDLYANGALRQIAEDALGPDA